MPSTLNVKNDTVTSFADVRRVALVGMNKDTFDKTLPDLDLAGLFPNANIGSTIPALRGETVDSLRAFFKMQREISYHMILSTSDAINRARAAVEGTLSSEATFVELPELPNPNDRFDAEKSFDRDVEKAIDEIIARIQSALS